MELFAVSAADAVAEAFSNQDNQVYFGKGQIALREGEIALGCRQLYAKEPELNANRHAFGYNTSLMLKTIRW